MCSEHMSSYGKWHTDDWSCVVVPNACSTERKHVKRHRNGNDTKAPASGSMWLISLPTRPSYTHTESRTLPQNVKYTIVFVLFYISAARYLAFFFIYPKYLAVKTLAKSPGSRWLRQNFLLRKWAFLKMRCIHNAVVPWLPEQKKFNVFLPSRQS